MISINARAKINLTLDINGLRGDGYHEVKMTMQSVSLSDTVKLAEAPGGITLAAGPGNIPEDSSNLAWKAAALFIEKSGINRGVSIEIEKNIPVAAGLAGGSADAAATLRGMNLLFKTGYTAGELSKMGAEIGSDVPFCVMGGAMLATGRGEILERLPALPKLSVLIASPPVEVPTAWAYGAYDKCESARHPDTGAVVDAFRRGDVETLLKNLYNVLEPVTVGKFPVVGDYINIIRKFVPNAIMSGSGPSVFAVSETAAPLLRARDAIAGSDGGARIFMAETVGEED